LWAKLLATGVDRVEALSGLANVVERCFLEDYLEDRPEGGFAGGVEFVAEGLADLVRDFAFGEVEVDIELDVLFLEGVYEVLIGTRSTQLNNLLNCESNTLKNIQLLQLLIRINSLPRSN
jgi:hypothetical protein